ncbi:MAG: hypothetical protein GY822_09860 [Deltaproteobacteria bacterium]|nr:hypothetical protein [Deltaproteobacteria bacterium]
MSGALTLGGAFSIPSGEPDPGNPGEYLAGVPSSVLLGFAPDGQCSNACDATLVDDDCGECATCSIKVGPKIFDAVGITAQAFSADLSFVQTGMCRQNCLFDSTGTTRGG